MSRVEQYPSETVQGQCLVVHRVCADFVSVLHLYTIALVFAWNVKERFCLWFGAFFLFICVWALLNVYQIAFRPRGYCALRRSYPSILARHISEKINIPIKAIVIMVMYAQSHP